MVITHPPLDEGFLVIETRRKLDSEEINDRSLPVLSQLWFESLGPSLSLFPSPAGATLINRYIWGPVVLSPSLFRFME